MKKTIKVAISQRIIPDFRVPLFAELNRRDGIEVTVYYGKGWPSGSQQNSTNIKGFKHKKLFTFALNFRHQGIQKYRVFHPILPFRILLGDYDTVITEPTTNIFNNIFLYPLCKISGKKFIWYTAGPPGKSSRIRWAMMKIAKIMIRGADACITYNSEANRDLLKLGIEPNKIFRAQNSIDTKKIKEDVEMFREEVPFLRKKLNLEDSKVALFIGGIEKRKRIDNLIKAARIVRAGGINVKVLIVGDGPYEEELKNNLSREQGQFTIFSGRHVERAPLYILASDLVVLPGQGGLAINQALSCGRPCIATEEAEGPAVRDYIKDNVNGYVVPINDVTAIAEKMKLIFDDKELWLNLCTGAQNVAGDLSIENMVDSILDAIHSCFKDPW